MSIDFNYLLKYIIIGNSGVGKSNILLRYINDSFDKEFKTTIGVEFGSKNIKINNKIYRTQIWDTAGQETFRSITRAYYKNSVCACLVYDITDKNSLNDIQNWVDECKKQASKTLLFVLVGNKSDLEVNRKVTYDEGKEYATKNNFIFLETSALSGKNINEIFELSVKKIDENLSNGVYDLNNDGCGIKEGIPKTESFTIKSDKGKKTSKKKCC